MPEASGLENKLPVFTTPHSQITFYADDPSSLKQILTIINPYDFLVKFKILVSSNDSSKYTVSAPQGTIKPHHSVDVILQHVAVTTSSIGVLDKVRVLLYSSSQVGASGKKDLSITLLDSAPKDRVASAPSESERFQQLEADPSTDGHLRQHPFIQEKKNGKAWYICALVMAVLLLVMPKEGDESEYFPTFLPRPSYEMKIMIAYLSGMATVLLIQS